MPGRTLRRTPPLALVLVLTTGCSGGDLPSADLSTPASTPTPVPSVQDPSSPSPTPSPAPTAAPSVDVAAAREAFDYPPVDSEFVVLDSTGDGSATIRDVTYASVDGRTVSAYVVTPVSGASAGPSPAVLFLHWYATNEPDGDRTEFLDEAVDLAADGVVSLLPQQVFPWTTPPTGAMEDRQAVIDQIVDIRVGLDVLLRQPEVDPVRVAVVGHDFGGMYAAVVAGLDDRIDAAAILAGVPRWSDWYLRYWNPVPAADAPAYQATMVAVDPVTFLPTTEIPLLFQFAESDQFVNQAAIETWLEAAPDARTTVETYAWNHSLRTEDASADRRAFVASALRLPD